MSKENPKYRTHDSPRFVEPVVDWGPSLTDPSQDIPVSRLVARHTRLGKPAHNLPYGDDLSRVGFTELHTQLLQASESVKELQEADRLAAVNSDAAKLAADKAALKPGSPELAKLAADLTAVLPGLQALVSAPK